MDLRIGIGTFIAAAGLLAGTGCVVTPLPPIEQKPLPFRDQADLPVPHGFTLMPTESHLYDRSFRALRFTYVRRNFTDLERTVHFYKRLMPEDGWQLRWEVGMHERKMLFERGDEQCEVVVNRWRRYRAVRATVTVEPSPALSSYEPAQPAPEKPAGSS